jgi:hypothetical protein
MVEEANSCMTHLIHCKNLCKYHNVPPLSTTIKENFSIVCCSVENKFSIIVCSRILRFEDSLFICLSIHRIWKKKPS